MKSKLKIKNKLGIKLIFLLLIGVAFFYFFKQPIVEGLIVYGKDVSGNTLTEVEGITLYQSYVLRTILNNTDNAYSDDERMKDIRAMKINDRPYKNIIKNSNGDDSRIVLKKLDELLKKNENDLCTRAEWEEKKIAEASKPT